MHNHYHENELQLSRFGEYLLRQRLVSENRAKYFVQWVRRFLYETPHDPTLSLQDRILAFVDRMRRKYPECPDWKLDEAEKSLRLYFHNFKGEGDWSAKDAQPVRPARDGTVVPAEALASLRAQLRVRHYSYRTEQTYVDWVGRFFHYLDETGGAVRERHVVTPQGVKDFLAWLALRRHVSASTQNQAFSALLFLCRDVLGIELGDLQQGVRAKRGRRLPVVMSPEEVQRLFRHLEGTGLLMAQLIYSGGLRVMECCRMRVKDIDFDNNLVFVRGGKGDKDRSTLLAEAVKAPLQKHLEWRRRLYDKDLAAGLNDVWLPDALARKYPAAPGEWGWQWLFPSPTLSTDPRSGKVRRHHLSDMAIQRAVKNAVRAAGIEKPVSVHTLRHSFATHLLLHGSDIRQIQDYLGHSHVETTMVYTHVVKDLRRPAKSPLDML